MCFFLIKRLTVRTCLVHAILVAKGKGKGVRVRDLNHSAAHEVYT